MPQKVTKSSPLVWHLVHNIKSTVRILSNFVAFLENINFMYICWFSAKNQSNFVSLSLKLDNSNCHNQRGPPWISSKATSSFMSWSWRCSLTTLSSKAQESWSLHNASTVTKELDRRTYLLSDVPNKFLSKAKLF